MKTYVKVDASRIIESIFKIGDDQVFDPPDVPVFDEKGELTGYKQSSRDEYIYLDFDVSEEDLGMTDTHYQAYKLSEDNKTVEIVEIPLEVPNEPIPATVIEE
jgi:hypothetical protein